MFTVNSKINELDPEAQRKVKSDMLRKLLVHMEQNPHVSEANLLTVFGINRQMIYTQCPWLRPEARAKASQAVATRAAFSGFGSGLN